MIKPGRAAMLGAFALGALSLNGCWFLAAGAVAGAAAYSYQINKLETIQEYPVETVHKAALACLKDLEIRTLRETVDKLTGHIEAQNAQGKSINIDENRLTEHTTKVAIRVGTGLLTEDKIQAEAIYDAFNKRLK